MVGHQQVVPIGGQLCGFYQLLEVERMIRKE